MEIVYILIGVIALFFISAWTVDKFVHRHDDEIELTITRKGKKIDLNDEQLNNIIEIITQNEDRTDNHTEKCSEWPRSVLSRS